MNLISQWSQNNLDIVFFIYGLAFVIMGIAIWVQPKNESKFENASTLSLLSGFGLIHGTNEFLDMWAIIKGRSPALDIVRSFFRIASYLFLFEFGRRLLRISGEKYLEKITKLLGWWLTSIIGFAILIFGFISTDFWETGTIWARYLLGFPGGVLIGFGFVLYYKYKKHKLEPLKVKKYFFCASLFFLVYGILGGLVVPKGNFFPSNFLNTDSFLSLVRIPVQIFRAFCAIIVTWVIYRILGIFNLEIRIELQNEITERKQAQAQLIQSAKMASVGLLAVGVAHEINNPIFAISGEAEMLLKDETKDIETKDASKAILEQVKRIKGITERILLFSRQKEFKREPLDENQIQEVFLNIMLNAVQAMEGEGRLTIRTYSEKIRENGRRKTDKFKLGNGAVIIEFRNTGKGMDEQTLNKLFSPFLTTKEKGTGLGLFICYGIIENHGGIIEAQSKLGEGV